MDHGVLGPDQHGEELAGELERGGAHQPRRLLADPYEEVGVGVQDVDVLGKQQFLLQLISWHLHLTQRRKLIFEPYSGYPTLLDNQIL